MASTTRGSECPTFIVPIPPPKSIKVLPSTSVMVAPPASWAKMGAPVFMPAATAPCRRSMRALLFGPGISVFIRVESSILSTPFPSLCFLSIPVPGPENARAADGRRGGPSGLFSFVGSFQAAGCEGQQGESGQWDDEGEHYEAKRGQELRGR